MRYTAVLMILATTALPILAAPAEAQSRQRQARQSLGQGSPLVLRVTPRSYLDPGNVVPVGSINPGYSGYGQTQSYLLSPPYAPSGAGFGVGTLPDPITNGPFVGSRNPFGPVDFVTPPGLAR
ncbi:hypothetical protein VB618_08310 [Microvirga sp. CF3062]|uniref:hypothetical protein n=1 Tax=Microvirga sp. CF3062 TaxID=3110182 RepID=UPI002E79F47A|nr:hypothetical protein [Microvirga sp. CF3062]MEE1656197.1 hypothetical protein [Microvirga sp. CF3062]